ncbi:hypothetical protein PFISCL1PPCAC_18324, partial [Pristionchus fissidentatus]
QMRKLSQWPLMYELIATDFVLILCVYVCTGIMLCAIRHKAKEMELEVKLLQYQLGDEMPNDRKNFEIVARHLQKHTFERFSLALN